MSRSKESRPPAHSKSVGYSAMSANVTILDVMPTSQPTDFHNWPSAEYHPRNPGLIATVHHARERPDLDGPTPFGPHISGWRMARNRDHRQHQSQQSSRLKQVFHGLPGRWGERCDRWGENQQLVSMQSRAEALEVDVSSGTEVEVRETSSSSALSEFEGIYRANVGVVTAYFARRCGEPQTVADLTSETIVRAAAGFAGFDPRRGTARSWLFGIARHVFAQHCADSAAGRDVLPRLVGFLNLPAEEIDELTERIDAERSGRCLLERCAALSTAERAASELVDLDGLTPKEAAAVLGIPRGVLRMRLSRARARLRKEHHANEEI
jgi:RNA polymerase sigma factor (sigma-70 family)